MFLVLEWFHSRKRVVGVFNLLDATAQFPLTETAQFLLTELSDQVAPAHALHAILVFIA
jgi:hypothetical protein